MIKDALENQNNLPLSNIKNNLDISKVIVVSASRHTSRIVSQLYILGVSLHVLRCYHHNKLKARISTALYEIICCFTKVTPVEDITITLLSNIKT